jgi:K+-sensing histidine kinase KdpD
LAYDLALNGRGRWFDRQRPYVIGLGTLVLAAAAKVAVDPLVDTRTPFLLLLGAVMTAAWYGGLLPGLATTLLAALVGDYLFVSAGASITSGDAGAALRLGLFLVEGSLISILVSRLGAARPSGRASVELAERAAAWALGCPGSRV